MRIPRLPLALVGSLGVGGVAWYAYKGDSAPRQAFEAASPISSPQTRSLTTAADIAQPTAAPTDAAPVTAGHEPNRKALVVDNDQFFTGSIVGSGPLAKDTDDYGRKVLEMMTPEQATERLRRTEQSYFVNRNRGVVRYDLVQLPSNDPIEDDHAEKIIEIPSTIAHTGFDGPNSSDWMFWGVFDGHSGWTTSAKLRQLLISTVARELNTTYRLALTNKVSPLPNPADIDTALKNAFINLDNEICLDSVDRLTKNPSKRLAAEILAPALSGSCALLSFYDAHSQTLRVACTGDSRAVLGRLNPTTKKWYATPLSEDQTGSNPNEAARLRSAHPGEDNVVRNGRVLGNLEPTRAFGDAFYKWTRETQDKIKKHFFGRTPSQWLRTPPYVTAEPVVQSVGIEPSKGDFVILATDGLWEMLTNEEAVGLVGQWLEQQKREAKGNGAGAWLGSWFKSNSTQLPVEKGGNMDKTGRTAASSPSDARGQEELPIRQQQYASPSSPSFPGEGTPPSHSRFVVEDKNVATHLVRNALGGRDRDMVCALLTLPSPYSRRYRDDLTVTVVFFGEGAKDGKGGEEVGDVRINAEGTAGGPGDVKAKL
jgi:pyruvate dehydrogenase phosphatase